MEVNRSNAGQGLGIAALVLGILAIPAGLIPCTFFLGIFFGILGLVLALVALTQANRGNGPKTVIIAAFICAMVGLAFSSVWGLVVSREGGRMVRDMIENGIQHNQRPPGWEEDEHDVLRHLEEDSLQTEDPGRDNINQMMDTLKALEGIEE